MNFTHLHCHSHFSLLDGLSKIEPLVQRTVDLGMESLAITDHGVMYGTVDFYNQCQEAGIKPIIGLEAYVAQRRMEDKEGKIDSDYYHLTLLCKNEIGYKNLIELTTQAHLKGFYYKPRIDKEILKKHSEGLIALSGCMRGEVARACVSDNHTEAQKALDNYLDIFGKENFFIELQRNSRRSGDTARETILNERLYALAKKNGLRPVATADSHYIYPEDAEAQDVLVCIGTGKTTGDVDRLNMTDHDLSLKSPQAMAESFYDIPEAVENTMAVSELCNLNIKTNQRYFPRVEVPKGLSPEDYLKEKVYEGSQKLYANESGQIIPSIQERIDYELEIICKKGFATYFLMVADIVSGAHAVGAVTNTRGSAAGSIVGKILGITNVDPLYYELPFERFLTMHRPTPPDIDLDIADDRRDEAIKYITDHYGHEKVAQIITFGTMMARAAVRDAGRALGVPYAKCDRIAKMIPLGKQGFHMTLDKALEMNPELKEIYTLDEETKHILDIAKKLEGCARHASIHAAGIVITPEPLTEYMPLQKEPDGERLITQYDMYALDVNANAKALGVIKMDLLGIRNLTILEKCVKLVEARHGTKIDIYNLPHPDAKTFQLLSGGLTFGVFQMGSSGMTRYLKELKPSNVFDIMAMIALYRPGPMQFIPDYIARKHNPKLIKYFDPSLEKILHRTYGILVYQDDLLTIAHDLAGYSWEEVDKFRKAVGKKIPAEMAKQKIKFIQGCADTVGWSQSKAAEIWAWIEPFAAYGFNKSHSASYAIVSYQTAYMKANYPVEFMAALMTAESGDEDKIYAAVEECEQLGIKVLPPDVNESFGNFTVVDEHNIRFGLHAIKNLGSDVVRQVIEIRKERGDKFKSLEDFLISCYTRNLNKKSWEALVKSGALDAFGERGTLLANTEHVLDFLREHFKTKDQGQNSLFGNSMQMGRLTLKPATEASEEQMLAWEKEHLGMYVSAHPLDSYKDVLKSFTPLKSLTEDMFNNVITAGGIITKIKRTLTRKNDPMAFFTMEDLGSSIEVLVFPKVMSAVLPFLEEEKIIEVTGRISDKDGDFKIIADEIKELPNDKVYGEALAEMQKGQEVYIHMNNANNPEALNKIKDVIIAFPGNAQVFLTLGTGNAAKTIKTKSQVTINKDLVSALRTIPEVILVSDK